MRELTFDQAFVGETTQGFMRPLTINEIDAVGGAVDQATAIGTNMGIIAIGVGILAAGATAPVWFPMAMIAISVTTTIVHLK